MSELTLEITANAHATIVHFNGSAGLEGSAELDRKLTILSAQRPNVVIFELSRLTFISSLAMGSLISFAHGLTRRGGKVAITGAQPMVDQALRRIRMESVMPLYASVDEVTATASARPAL